MSSLNPERAAVVTVTYNSCAQVSEFLDSLAQTTLPGDHIIVVENRSPQAEATRQTAAAHGVNFVCLPSNAGYGSAMNRGVATLDSGVEYVLISNPDVRLNADTLPALVDWLDTHRDCGAVAPQILNEDGTVYPSARSIPSLRNGVGHALFARFWPDNPWSRHYRADADYGDTPRDAGWLSGACLLVRRSTFEKLGGFDEGFFMYFEDVDLGYRLGLDGWASTYLPTVSATHTGGTSTRTDSDRMLRIHHESAYRFMSKKYNAWYFAPLRLVLRVGLWARFQLIRRSHE
ncbi:glycosyltransferase family 2 protein [Mycetocola saprophilus]|uniref:glycosyltransferase family 2 protein n=1 Tax=Mycetocola saprophilus TaxID=76636 RepID=UPI003BF1FF0F